MRDKQSQAHASYHLGFRRSLFEKRKQLCDLALVLAALGIALMVLDNELYTFHNNYDENNQVRHKLTLSYAELASFKHPLFENSFFSRVFSTI